MPAKVISEWEASAQRPRVPEDRHFISSVNPGKIVPDIDVLIANPDDYPSTKKYIFLDEASLSVTIKAELNRRKNAIALQTRNPLAVDLMGCTRRRIGKGSRIFEDCVVARPERMDRRKGRISAATVYMSATGTDLSRSFIRSQSTSTWIFQTEELSQPHNKV